MDIKKKQKPRPAGRLDLADRQISVLKKKLLPYDPHLLKVDIKNPYNGGFAYEFENTPFETYEVKDLQYMTMISEGSRGIADARGDWQDEINSRSPSVQAARSNTATPNPGRESKAPLKKISIADYKNRKAGIKTTPKPSATDDDKLEHSRNTSAVSFDTPMSRVPSFEGAAEVRQNGASLVAIATEKAASKEVHKSAAQPSITSDPKPKSTPTRNGHADQPSRGSIQSKDTNKDSQPPKTSTSQPREQLRHGLPPRPQSPSRKNVDRKPPTSEPRQLKRPLESADSPHEKRAKIEHTRTSSGLQTNPLRRSEPHSEKKQQASPLKPSSQPSKTTPSSKLAEGKDASKLERPLKIPPLLSPLPADLDNSPAPVPKVRISEPAKNSSNSPKPKIGPDTIVVKSKLSTSSPLSTPPKSSAPNSSPYVLPRLLSPTLPDVVEEELLRIHKKSTAAAQNTVEARHEKARRPDAPGVARKTPKVAKKTTAEVPKPPPVLEKDTLVVKLKYKKRRANDISRILKLESRPSKEYLRLEKERIARLKPKDDSEEEMPLAAITKPAPKKRPNDSLESRPIEPAAKRVKVPDTIEVSKTRPTNVPSSQAKSPLLSAPNQKSLLATPKKGDALKSVAMRKIDSSDGHARTPQAASTSTPASAEKPRLNGDSRSSAETETLRTNVINLDAQSLKLKRKMDEILQTKSSNRNITESQKILGLCVGLECIVMYMQSFAAKDRLARHRNNVAWEGGMKLWEYIDGLTRQFPIINVLSIQIGAIFREELGRAYIEMLKDNQTSRFLEILATNELGRDKLWKQVQRSRSALEPLEIKEVTGPWTSVEEITIYTINALEKYARKEKTGWRLTN